MVFFFNFVLNLESYQFIYFYSISNNVVRRKNLSSQKILLNSINRHATFLLLLLFTENDQTFLLILNDLRRVFMSLHFQVATGFFKRKVYFY